MNRRTAIKTIMLGGGGILMPTTAHSDDDKKNTTNKSIDFSLVGSKISQYYDFFIPIVVSDTIFVLSSESICLRDRHGSWIDSDVHKTNSHSELSVINKISNDIMEYICHSNHLIRNINNIYNTEYYWYDRDIFDLDEPIVNAIVADINLMFHTLSIAEKPESFMLVNKTTWICLSMLGLKYSSAMLFETLDCQSIIPVDSGHFMSTLFGREIPIFYTSFLDTPDPNECICTLGAFDRTRNKTSANVCVIGSPSIQPNNDYFYWGMKFTKSTLAINYMTISRDKNWV